MKNEVLPNWPHIAADFEKFYRISPYSDELVDQWYGVFTGRLMALCGDSSAWASLQAAKRREEAETRKALGGGNITVKPAKTSDELDAQFAVAAAVLRSASG